nr:M1 family metallopeptidase [uncultured Carboxylicivirga sp.]
MKKVIFTFFVFLIAVFIQAQESRLFEPLNYQYAIAKGTRSRDGKPGPQYWQNRADYHIQVKLDTAINKIIGDETVLYFNQSPDTLKNLVIRLYPNLFKKGTNRNRMVSADDLHGGVVFESLVINDSTIEVDKQNENGTNLLIKLKEPVPPNQQLAMQCKWNYPVPVKTRDRVGYYKDDAWFIGYFYPQIAVYDDLEIFGSISGWDFMLYHKGIQQFYNDFNNYKVNIEVPKGYYVWATGELTNAKDVLPTEIQNRIALAKKSDTIVPILAKGDAQKFVPGNNWQFEAQNVTDFAFGTSATYQWDATSVQLKSKRVMTSSVYHSDSKLYHMVADFTKETVKYASEVYPAIEFPYNYATVFNGKKGGGMEFPMVANNAEIADTTSLHGLCFHEVFHNYFPFMMGFNEKRYGFMDEGMTEYYTTHYQLNKMQKPFKTGRGPVAYYNRASVYADAPLIYSTAMENRFNTGLLDYIKPQIAYELFSEMVGEKAYINAMQQFVKRWQGKHPVPWDFFYTMNDVLGQNYNWFWQAWFFDFGYADLGLKLEGKKLTIERVGVNSLPVPVYLIITFKDDSYKCIYKSMDVWKDGAQQIIFKLKDIDRIKSISIDVDRVPDVNYENNKIVLD